jgi:opacity protein-like surface antigen
MLNPRITALAAVLASLLAPSLALSADYGMKYGYPPPPVEIGSGWYLRGDLGYRLYAAPSMTETGAPVALTGTSGAGAFSFGAGFGYQFTENFRGDLTVDLALPAVFRGTIVGGCNGGADDCTHSVDVSAGTVMANAYWDLATVGSVTPYVGAGAGVAYLSTAGSSAVDESGPTTVSVPGASRINFAWALMGGATWEMSPDTLIDLSFKLVSLGSARTGPVPATVGGDDASPIVTGNILAPEVRLGMRYKID